MIEYRTRALHLFQPTSIINESNENRLSLVRGSFGIISFQTSLNDNLSRSYRQDTSYIIECEFNGPSDNLPR